MKRATPSSGTSACAGVPYDSVLIVSFGGPEGPDDVEPFLANVTAGRRVPPERLAAVARQYQHFGGISPINEQCRRLRTALEDRLAVPVYWGNRNWSPYLADAVAEMAAAGHRRALAVVTSAYSSYSGCRQYLEDIAAARAAVGESAPSIDKIGAYHDHRGFVDPFADAVAHARDQLPASLRSQARLIFTAHSIPEAMAAGCAYEQQLHETAALVARRGGFEDWTMAWQSRSGPPSVPWLEPDINDCLRSLARLGTQAAVLAPIGFVTDHMEVLWDLDIEAARTAASIGMAVTRAVTPGTVPDERFVSMWHQLIDARLDAPLGQVDASSDRCLPGCCPPS